MCPPQPGGPPGRTQHPACYGVPPRGGPQGFGCIQKVAGLEEVLRGCCQQRGAQLGLLRHEASGMLKIEPGRRETLAVNSPEVGAG